MNELKRKLTNQINRDADLPLAICFLLFSLYCFSYVADNRKDSSLVYFLIVVSILTFSLSIFLLIRNILSRRKTDSMINGKKKYLIYGVESLFAITHLVLFFTLTLKIDLANNKLFDYSFSYINDIFFGFHFLYVLILRLYISSFIAKEMSEDVTIKVDLSISNSNKNVNDYYFGNKLCELRENLYLTQAEVAAILKVSNKAISKWENGSCYPSSSNLKKLSSLYKEDVGVYIKKEDI